MNWQKIKEIAVALPQNFRSAALRNPSPRAFPNPTLLCLILCSSVVLLTSCGSFKEPEFRGVENLRINRLGGRESALSMDVRYFNPNNIRLNLKKISGETWLDGSYLGRFNMDTLIHIPAKGEFTLPVNLQVDMSKLLQNSLAAFLSKEVTIRIEGKAKLGKGIIFINYPIRYEGKQDLEKLLK